MKKTFKLKIISFEKLILECDTELISLPGKDGRFAVEPNHMNISALLTDGQVRIKGTKINKSLPISGGIFFFEKNDALLMLSE